MSAYMIQVALVVWRESIEALLVIGVLHAWLQRQPAAERKRGQGWLRAGIVAGLLAALLIACVILFVGEWLDGDRQDYFQATMVLVAAALILQMVHWMRRQGPGAQRALEGRASQALSAANGWGLLLIPALAIAREGSETTIFLYGILVSSGRGVDLLALTAAGLGFAAAIGLYLALQFGARALSWTSFFRFSEAMLLILAGSLLMNGLDRLISLDVVSPLSQSLWDTSWLLDDGRGVGGLLATLTGYRARPELLPVIVFGGYWFVVSLFGSWGLRKAAAAS
ncbi:high-affinity iron transporter [Rhizobium azooxidifex]|uniref:High-affinity iron transporter n=1 Tax=Mycoplana azooxidifex TaxID=1636188 RepID=A0A7W6GHZ1_9HYPH|nr:FTR1 family protein [Mycoplana azooxidifex]MBB3975632.1 high-affinity iron transporter [Mycoplana azooxidifex]